MPKRIIHSIAALILCASACQAKELSLSDLAPGRYGYVDPKTGLRGSYYVPNPDAPNEKFSSSREKPLPLEYLPLVLREDAKGDDADAVKPSAKSDTRKSESKSSVKDSQPTSRNSKSKPKGESAGNATATPSINIGGSSPSDPLATQGKDEPKTDENALQVDLPKDSPTPKKAEAKSKPAAVPKEKHEKAPKPAADESKAKKWLTSPFHAGKGLFKGVGRTFGSGYDFLFDSEGGSSSPSKGK